MKVNDYVALVTDHGHKNISGILSLDAFLREKYRAKNVQKDLTLVAGQAVSGTMPSDPSGFDCLIAAGEGHACTTSRWMGSSTCGRRPTSRSSRHT